MQTKKLTAALCAAIMLFALLLAGCDTAPVDNADGTTTSSSTTASTTATTTKRTTAATTTSINLPAWEGTTTTVSVDIATQSPSKLPVRDLLTVTQNADGTSTDNSDGTVFIDDTLDTLEGDGKKYYKMKSLLAGDGVLTARQGASEAYISYRLRRTTDAAVFTLVPSGTAVGQEFKAYISADGDTWEEVPVLAYREEAAAEGVVRRTSFFEFKNKTVKYFKIQPSTDNPAYQLDRVRVNNVQKLHHPYQSVEAREPATFYIDAQNGSDDNDGLSEATAYKTLQKAATRFFIPGDKILLKRGCTFAGGVELRGLGLAKRRLYIGAYGKGADPVIAGGGNPALAVKMDYVTVENLEITNPEGVSAMALRTNHTGAVKGIIIQDCYFHDVNSGVQLFTYSSGGIHAEVSERTAPTWLEGLVIRRNSFKDLGRCAVYTTTIWASREGAGWGSGGNKNYIDDDNGWWPSVNMSITDNTMFNITGDAVVIIGVRGLRMARNFVSNAYCITTDELTRILNTQGTNRCAATLWSINANDVYVEHNEVGYTRMPGQGGDGEAFDIDAGHKRIFIQYNYSHHNSGGFLLICGTEGSNKLSRDYVVRHNLSVGEGGISLSNVNTPTDIYNNTFILGDYHKPLCFYSNAENLCFRNNIFSGKNGGNIDIPSNYPIKNLVFDNNVYTGGATFTQSVFSGRKEMDGPRWGVHILPNGKEVENVFAVNHFDAPEYVSSRAEAIAMFTPQVKIDGAYKTPATVDINGTPITTPFYGCVAY